MVNLKEVLTNSAFLFVGTCLFFGVIASLILILMFLQETIGRLGAGLSILALISFIGGYLITIADQAKESKDEVKS